MGCGSVGLAVAKEERVPEAVEPKDNSCTQGGFVSVDNEENDTVNPDAIPLTEKACRQHNEKDLDAKLTALDVIDSQNCVVEEAATDNQSVNMDDFS